MKHVNLTERLSRYIDAGFPVEKRVEESFGSIVVHVWGKAPENRV